MITVECRTRKWGNSIGIAIPKEIVEREKIRPNEKIRVFISKNKKLLVETFGTWKFDKSTDEMMRETDAELYD